MAEKKKSSCFGMFLKGFVISSLLLGNLAAAAAMLAVKFLGADAAAWTDISHPTSRPFLVLYAVLFLSLGLGAFLGLAGAAVSAMFSGSKKSGSASRSSRPRPQSSRRTTV